MMDGRRHDSHAYGILTQSNTFYVTTKLNLNEFPVVTFCFYQYRSEAGFQEAVEKEKTAPLPG